MDIDLLATFLEVNKTRHFGRAAENLYLTPAAVSARIRQLEEGLGVRLFSRARLNIQLTDAGQRLLPHARHLLEVWTQARADVSAAPVAGLAPLRIAATPLLWHFALSQLAPPAPLSLQLSSGSETELLALLQSEQLDAVVALEPVPVPGVICTPLRPLVLCLQRRQLAALQVPPGPDPYVHVGWGAAFQHFFERRLRAQLQPVLQLDAPGLLLNWLQALDAWAFLPAPAVQRGADGEHWQVMDTAPVFRAQMCLLYRPELADDARRRALQDYLCG